MKTVQLQSAESLHEQHADSGAYLLCLLVVLGDVGIVMQTKDLWAGVERQGADVVDVALVGALWGGVVQAARREPVRRQNLALRQRTCQKVEFSTEAENLSEGRIQH